MAEFRMPSLGADMDEGTLVEWLVSVGDRVHRNDIVAVVDTEKSTIEVEVFDDGVIAELLVEPGVTVPVGTPLARIETADDAPLPEPEPDPLPEPGQPPAAPHRVTSPLVRHQAEAMGVDLSTIAGTGAGGVVTRADVEAAARPVPPPPRTPTPPHDPQVPQEGRRLRASPLARRQAEAAGIDLGAVAGSGPDGAVLAADLDTPGAAGTEQRRAASGSGAARHEPADRRAQLRRAVGDLMARSAREIPHYHLTTTIDMATAMAWLEQRNEGRPPSARILPAALLLHATVRAASTTPSMNGHWVDGQLVAADHVHLGVAVSLRGGGLVAPAIRNADELDLDTLMARLRDLVTRARAGTLRGSELTDPTITVTNLGDAGVDAVHGVIFPPQVALVGFGRIAERPWARDGMLGVHPTVTATLAADHRASDGREGARLLAAIDHHLQHPEIP